MTDDALQSPERAYQIYDALRDYLLNQKYFGSRLTLYRGYNFWMELLIAVGATGSGVAGFSLWQKDYGQLVWGLISAISVLLAIAKPLLNLTGRVEIYAKLYGEYTTAYVKMKRLVDDMQVEKTISTARMKSFDDIRDRAAELASLKDPAPKPEFVRKLQSQVNEEIRIDLLWLPIGSVAASAASPPVKINAL